MLSTRKSSNRVKTIEAEAVDQVKQLELEHTLLCEAEHLLECGSWCMEHHNNAVIWSPELRRMLALAADHPASLQGLLKLIPDQSRDLVATSLRQSWLTRGRFRMEHPLQTGNGQELQVLHHGETIHDEQGHPLRTIGVLQTITQHVKQRLLVERSTTTDNLTGLPNQQASVRLLEQRLREMSYNQQLAVISLDLDDFQILNECFGIDVGNALLRWTAEHLRQQLQNSDWLARLESDRFLVVRSEGISNQSDALALARQLQASIKTTAPYLEPPLAIQLSACIGVSVAPDHGNEARNLLHGADTALCRAKREGKNRLQIYSAALSKDIRTNLDVEQGLANAMDRQQLELHYQPQFNSSGQLCGAEALLRWHKTKGETVPPDQFIPIAEQSGLIHAIGRWVLEEALEQFSHWRALGLRLPQLGINVSAKQLDPEREPLDDILMELCRRSDVPPECLELELTETALLSNPEDSGRTLKRLAQQGVRVAIDDFGTGFSSLATLQRLPLHRLKIDRCFVQALPNNPADRSIVKATILMAHELGLTCLAEGVEHSEQHQQLLDLGCDSFQGYLMGKPMPAEMFQQCLIHN